MSYVDPLDQQALEVQISELLVATADSYDHELDRRITDVLLLLRKQLRMDVVFVSEFIGRERVFRFVDGSVPRGPQTGDVAPLEESYCQRVVEGRLPELVNDTAPYTASGDLPHLKFLVGTHLSTPVVLPDGRIYGTVCCFSESSRPDLQQSALACLRQCARLVARKVDSAPSEPEWQATEPAPFPEITK
ncbi:MULTISPECIES: GAF domain-containing protein [unclassified Roseateles]|uniref:GAF domain-containing protein n=1 Tax=unclassified Roseateles TaxID=2626991 RepID=UPI0006FD9320|nr:MULTISPECIES: GAF domain-containing protein [unclassified Roseateles]KQW45402.1 hypothetical protein ASC81_10800 [Pelomonas sp. Root405]KRA72246.1 hypothetical protein ASD88_10800 [Pelomonas sp. Root662]